MATVINDRLLPMRSDGESVEKKVGLKKSRIHELMKEGTFPKSVAIGGAVRWSEHELNLWIAAQLEKREAA